MGHGEIETIGEIAVGRPFAVGTEIGNRALDLDDDEVAGLAEGQHIGAPPVGERELDEAGIAELVERPAHATREKQRGGRLGRGWGGHGWPGIISRVGRQIV